MMLTSPLKQVETVVTFAAIVLLGVTGASVGYRQGLLAGEIKLIGYKREVADAQAAASAEALARYRDAVERGDAIARQLDAAAATIHALREQLRQRVSHVTTVYVPAPGAAPRPLPRAVFTRGFVRDYNAAFGLSAGDTAAAAAGADADGAAAGGAGAGLRDDDLLDSGVGEADLLAHAEDVGLWCRTVVRQRDALIAYLNQPENKE